MRFYLYFACLIFLLLCRSGHAKDTMIELQQVTLPEAIQLVAKQLNINVILSSSIKHDSVFNITKAKPVHVFKQLLLANGLLSERQGNVWLIAPQTELLKWKELNLKLNEIQNAMAPMRAHIWRIRYAQAETLAKLIHQQEDSLLSKRGHIKVDKRTNSLYAEDIAPCLAKLKQLIAQLDIPVKQIGIVARLVSIDSDFERELGIYFSNSAKHDKENGKENGKENNFTLALLKLPGRTFLDLKLAALENAGHAELISSPSLFASNQQTAVIEAGEEVPYQETSENGGTTVAFKKAVLALKVTPQILPGHRILLQLQINQDRPGNKMVQGMPTISTRKITTSILLKSGQTCVLGGIFEVSEEKGSQGLPFISHLPVIGSLFQQHHSRHNKRELLIFVTPKVVGEERQ